MRRKIVESILLEKSNKKKQTGAIKIIPIIKFKRQQFITKLNISCLIIKIS
jgi:hypothetical protein